MDDETYKIQRIYKDNDTRLLIATGLTLAEAQAHCRNPETTSSKCKESENVAHTAQYGAWFDTYEGE
jgi:hypothetical protein